MRPFAADAEWIRERRELVGELTTRGRNSITVDSYVLMYLIVFRRSVISLVPYLCLSSGEGLVCQANGSSTEPEAPRTELRLKIGWCIPDSFCTIFLFEWWNRGIQFSLWSRLRSVRPLSHEETTAAQLWKDSPRIPRIFPARKISC